MVLPLREPTAEERAKFEALWAPDSRAGPDMPKRRGMSEEIESRILRALLRLGLGTGLGLALLWVSFVPQFPGGCRLNANESAAIATLKNVGNAQRDFRERCVRDRDGDGRGEYGGFGEMAGATPPLLSSAFARVVDGLVTRSGYCFCVWLPARGGGWVAEGGSGAVDVDAAETTFRVAAWPASEAAARRAFFTDESGDVCACRNDGSFVGETRRVLPEVLVAPAPDVRPPVAPITRAWLVVQ